MTPIAAACFQSSAGHWMRASTTKAPSPTPRTNAVAADESLPLGAGRSNRPVQGCAAATVTRHQRINDSISNGTVIDPGPYSRPAPHRATATVVSSDGSSIKFLPRPSGRRPAETIASGCIIRSRKEFPCRAKGNRKGNWPGVRNRRRIAAWPTAVPAPRNLPRSVAIRQFEARCRPKARIPNCRPDGFFLFAAWSCFSPCAR